ncbi:Penicillin-binding protein 4 precursor [compost metagenome]
MSVYSNLAHKRKTKKDSEARKKAEYLASLPKHPVKRILYRLHPKRFWGYWFSKKGGLMALKIAGVGLLFLVLLVGALFAYYRKDLDQIRPGELAKRVQTTVTRYEDRNGTLLYEDKGAGNYKLVVDGNEISKYMKDATIAIEDRDFYKHNGVSPIGITRAVISNASGNSTQGGSTLTQQLVKQVFFADQAQERGLAGIPRKIKELILSIEVERMYNKDQIIDLYLNESPYGGRRNGVQSAAQTYFGKSAKDLTLPEAALLAAIPNQPGYYDPYNRAGNPDLVARQHKVLDNMVEVGSATREQADAAKKVAIIDSIKPEASQYENIKAPHFVQMVRSQLEQELGKATVGKGGLIVKTTLDVRIQDKLEGAMTDMFNSNIPARNGFTNGAATVEDTQTGQIVALVGSRDFNYEGYGQDNAATAYIQPGSTVKPFVFSELFKKNYGSGSVLSDTNFDKEYGAKVQNHDARFMGNINIRSSLALSRNIPAIKAMYIDGVQPSLQTIRDMGASSYCSQGADTSVGLASAIGGCGVRQIDMVNAYASLARMGVYKPTSTVLEVKNSQNTVLKKWTDTGSKQILDPQIPYIVSDILTDQNARAALHGRNIPGLDVPGVKTGVKTGTSDVGGKPKDLWIMNYSPVLAMGLWVGNPDTSPVQSSNSAAAGRIISTVMEYAHKDIYGPEGKWKSGDWFVKPAGVQTIAGQLYPSWYNKSKGSTNKKITFDTVSKKKATACTPEGARAEIEVITMTDPITKQEAITSPDGYDASKDDDVHKCDDVKPVITDIDSDRNGNTYTITITVQKGTFDVNKVTATVGGSNIQLNGSGTTFTGAYTRTNPSDPAPSITVTATDSGMYTGTRSGTLSN